MKSKSNTVKANSSSISLHAGQRDILALPGRFKIAICGRRFGKTTVGTVIAERAAATGKRVAWLDPTDDQCTDVYTEVKEHLVKPKGAWQAARKELRHKSGGIIRFVSGGKLHALRGPGWDLVIFDEAADISEHVWKTIVLPTLLDRDGKALLMGTPRGKANWLHRIFEHAAADKKWSRYHAPTSANPRITLKQLDALRTEMTEIEFRQEFEAEFTDAAESIFPGIEQHTAGPARGDGRRGKKYATGTDLGQRAFCVCISIDPLTNIAEGITRWNKQPWAVNEARVRSHHKRFPGVHYVDATGVGSKPAEDMEDICRPFVFTDATRNQAIKALAVAWENEQVKICADAQLINELRSMEWTQEGEAPHTQLVARSTGPFCDCVMALVLAWYARTRHGDQGAAAPGSWFSFA